MPHTTHVLVVEDDERLRRSVLRGLRRQIETQQLPADLLETDRAQTAFDMILAKPDHAWFVFTDNNLEQSSGTIQTGLDLIRCVHERAPRIRAFLILTSGIPLKMEDITPFGVDLFLPKPSDIAVVVGQLKRFLASD